ncbi:hypothetical protein FK535_01670 [Mycolicibacterium sp. 018/SC-01/001]|uniref:hypothetical protein n=1 Tax=Mycolicibacterium sp. 018/SC-01/001 TaxID=2592069 RepID=UPI00117F7869|nr:hypothetical protein [Mycolicibacterium sp. 018/SC-01/001]TRW89003.1 hypothetical protein FK535_01670 [Mycolicibacterium sp. 018/SC-01/001]
MRNSFRHILAIAMFAVLSIVVAACSGLQSPPGSTSSSSTDASAPKVTSPFDPTTTPTPPAGPLLAYRAADEIGVVDGTTKIATVAGPFAPSNDLITTEDGRFVFARTVDNHVGVLDVQDRRGGIRQIPVGPTLGTAGGSTIVWWEQPNRLMRLDLAAPNAAPQVMQTVDLPPAAGAGDPRLIVARGGTAVLARVEGPPSPFGGPDTLYAVRGPGPASSLGQVEANSPVTVARLSPDGGSLAYALYRASNDACGTAAVVQSDAAGNQQTFDVAATDPAAGFRITKLWWPQQGPPKLSLTTWRCGQSQAAPPVVWQLTEDRIAQVVPPTSALQTTELSPGQRALILPHTDGYDDPAGALVVEESSRRIPVKDNVDAIALIQPAP